MKQWQWLIVAATFFIWGNAAKTQERIQFRSLESSATVLDGYLYPSIGAGDIRPSCSCTVVAACSTAALV